MTAILALIFIVVVMLFLLSALIDDGRGKNRRPPDSDGFGYPSYQYEDLVESRID